MSKSSAAAKKPGTAVAASNKGPAADQPLAKTAEQALLAQIEQDTGGGFEEASRSDFAIPFLSILQDLSPQTKKTKGEYIQGARPGQIFNSVSLRLYDSLRVIPCHFSSAAIEWISRKDGGGFVKAHPANTPLREQAVRDGSSNKLPNGHELQMTAQHFVLIVEEDGTTEGALIAMKSTQLKYSRRWMSQMRAATIEVGGRLLMPPMWAWSYLLKGEEESNDQGTWYSWSVSDRQRVTDVAQYQQAKAFAKVMQAGRVKINYEDLQTQPEKPAEGGTPGDLDNEIDA